MEYINANIELFESTKQTSKGKLHFINPINTLKAGINTKHIGNFSIVSYITLLGSKNQKANNIIDKQGCLDVCIRLTKLKTPNSDEITYDLDKFTIDTVDKTNIIHKDATVHYMNYKRITEVDKITVYQPKGSYVIKVLVKESTTEKYELQSITSLEVK